MKSHRKKKSTLLRRATRFHPGMASSILGLAIVVGGIYLGAADATNKTTSTTCKPVAVKDIDSATPSSNQVVYNFKSERKDSDDGTRAALASVKAGSNCEGFKVSLVSYKTPKGGKPVKKQTMFDGQTKITSKHASTFAIDVPDCYYQIDLVYGNPVDLRTDSDYDDEHVALNEIRGGDNDCKGSDDEGKGSTDKNKPTPKPLTSPGPSHTPSTTGTGSGTSTGSGSGTSTGSGGSGTGSSTGSGTGSGTSTGSGSGSGSGTGTNSSGGSNSTGGNASIATNHTIPLAPGETLVSESRVASISTLLPKTGRTGQILTIIGALLITFGLLNVWLTQRHKLLLPNKRS